MNAFKILSLSIVMAFAPLAASAQEADLSPQHAACMDKASSTASMVECIAAETKQQDARLNKAYKAAMAGLTAERKKQLQQVQRTWIKFRDANCGFYNDPAGGTMARVEANSCVMTSTATRAHELESLGK